MSMGLGIGGHHAPVMKNDEWLTPPEILKALGEFDLDPCAPVKRPWDMAREHYTVEDNGLRKGWHGRVWCNPPYGREVDTWMARLAEHGRGIALTFARTETEFFFSQIWRRATAIPFIEGRLHFHYPDGRRCKANAGGPSALIAFGEADAAALAASGIAGALVTGWRA